MATLIAVYNSDGCVGRCDARCHDATSSPAECDCICGGANHGVGEKQAVSNTQKMAESWINEYKKQHGAPDLKFDVTQDVTQFKLFK